MQSETLGRSGQDRRAQDTASQALDIQDVRLAFGGLQVLFDFSLSVPQGERQALIGPNGAGKTTLLRVVTGELQQDQGAISILGQDVSSLDVHERARLGVSRTFQVPKVLGSLTVRENLEVALRGTQPPASWIRVGAMDVRRVDEQLEAAGLAEYANRKAHDLGYGIQRQLEIGMVLIQRPRLLLMDEPTAGLSVAEVEHLVETLRTIEFDTTLVLIEHNMDAVFALCDQVAVLNQGHLMVNGPANTVRNDPLVGEIYFGDGGVT